MSMPLRAAIGIRRSMSGGVSSGGGTTRSVATSPTSRRNPSKWNGWKPIRAFPALLPGDEGVGDSLRAERERAGREREAPVADVDREVPLEDVEPLVLVRVDVPRRAVARSSGDLEQPELAVGVLAADLDHLEHAQQPERLALVWT
jgi:hypothetical protein